RRAVAASAASGGPAALLLATAAGSSRGSPPSPHALPRRELGDIPNEDAASRISAASGAGLGQDRVRRGCDVGWNDAGRRSHTPAAATTPADPAACARLGAASTGSPVSPGDLPKRVDLEFLVGHDLLQPPVLALQLLQAFRVVGLQAAVLVSPAVIRRLRHLQVPGHICHLGAFPQQPVSLPQLADDLIRRMPASRHRDDPPSPTLWASDSHHGWTNLMGSGHEALSL